MLFSVYFFPFLFFLNELLLSCSDRNLGEAIFFIYLLRVVALSDEKSALNTNFQSRDFFLPLFLAYTCAEAKSLAERPQVCSTLPQPASKQPHGQA